MTAEQAELLIRLLTEKDIRFHSGLTAPELSQINTLFGITFPPDLQLLLQTALPVSDSFVNWRQGLHHQEETDKILARLAWPLEGILFDIRSNDLWLNSWGVKPDHDKDQASVVKEHYDTYPRLIPVYSHRYIPASPHQHGNPVFSVYQTDIIYYGYDLANYLANEFRFQLPEGFEKLAAPRVKIGFWSDFAD